MTDTTPTPDNEWTDRYQGRARCPNGHEFTATWYDTEQAAQTCPACGTTFTATWRGFTFEPEVMHRAPVTCPECGHEFIAYWPYGSKPAKRCDACGHEFVARLTSEPETVTICSPGQEPGR
jgi:ribosomal protein S27E